LCSFEGFPFVEAGYKRKINKYPKKNGNIAFRESKENYKSSPIS